jgi:molybdate transport system regulatory protein
MSATGWLAASRPGKVGMNQVKPRLRVLHGTEIALGPGKVALLERVAETGTISEAARLLGMSYSRAWNLIRTMNACFTQPLVEAERGGNERGHATLTETGAAAIALYRRMESDCLQACEAGWRDLQRYLVGDADRTT